MAKKIIDTAEWDRFVSENTESLDMSDHYDRGFADGLGVAEMFIDPLPIADEPQWIPVTERLPENTADVLVFRPKMKIEIGISCRINDEWLRYGKDLHGNDVITHWMPLPEPPEVK